MCGVEDSQNRGRAIVRCMHGYLAVFAPLMLCLDQEGVRDLLEEKLHYLILGVWLADPSREHDHCESIRRQ